jgi:hypothetical protein
MSSNKGLARLFPEEINRKFDAEQKGSDQNDEGCRERDHDSRSPISNRTAMSQWGQWVVWEIVVNCAVDSSGRFF